MASWFGKPNVDMYKDIHVNFLPLNHAYVIFNTSLDHIGVYSVSEDCYKCPYQRQKDEYNAFRTDKTELYKVYTGENTKWRILNHIHGDYIQPEYVRGLMCETKPTLEEYGVYRLDVGRCVMETEVSPVNIYIRSYKFLGLNKDSKDGAPCPGLPPFNMKIDPNITSFSHVIVTALLLFSLIILSFIVALGLVKLFLRRNKERYNGGLNLTARDNSDIMPSVHFLRGLLVILLIFVTTGGGGYPIFSKNYGGLTVANCLLFAYIFSIGLKIPIMFREDSRRGMSKWSMLGLIVLRSLVLLFIGVAIRAAAPRSRFLAAPLWEPVVCIAVSYLLVAVVYMIGTKQDKSKDSSGNTGTLMWSWILGAILLIIMLVSTHIFYYTECKPNIKFDALRTSWMAQGNNCQEDDVFSEVFNKNLLRVNRDEPFYVDSYYAFTEGLLGLISFTLTALIGLKAGVIYLYEEHCTKIKQWYVWAAIFGAAGVILAFVSSPLNFNLWPISTIFLTSFTALISYVSIYHLTEVRQYSIDVITTCGIASIATLSGHFLFSQTFPFYWGYADTHIFYLWQSTWIVCLWIVITVCWMRLRSYLITRVVNEGARRAVLAW